ncbi:MAG TPA: selenocysteine-specific translation elongation factor [Candidatus Sulfotelmatobacter sp.]|nr:selenocysteine-specific translation elongation factor [Candidatus Sulfotelmatobacter sp.]
MHVVGTAGHVDHGKSALVRALTGTEPDRWLEERLRGMTLDLGFALLRDPDGVEAGIVDVPGHERFVHTMLAGAAGMELVLFVVAANEGVRPQTVEHLAILDLLGVRRALLVLTKADLVDAPTLAASEAALRAAVRGTFAEDAPAIAVSSVTGAGLDALRAAVRDALRSLPVRPAHAPAFLPIDRVFALAGHGTIVTGTLTQGTLRIGDVVQVDPPGRSVRVRSLQVFGETKSEVAGGARVAVNLPGVEVGELHRGAVLADASLSPRAAVRVRFRPLPDALPLLRRRTPVRAHLGAAEILGTLVFDAQPVDLAAVEATLHLRRPAIVHPDEPFVARAVSPKRLLGGGTVAGAAEVRADGVAPDVAAVLAALSATGLVPRSAAELGARANVREERAADILADAGARGAARRVQRPTAYVDGDAADAFGSRVLGVLAQREHDAPWILGTTSLALARALEIDESVLVRLLAIEVDDGRIASRAGYYATPGHAPRLTAEQRAFFERVVPADAEQPLLPVALDAVVAELRRARIPGLAQAFDALLATGALVKVAGDVYRGAQVAEIRSRLETAIRREGPITMARFRDAVGTTRKYAVPLMEWFDATGVTVRDGDRRALRRPDRVAAV